MDQGAVTLIAAIIAAIASFSSIGVTLWTHRKSQQHADRTWLREQTYKSILAFHASVNSLMDCLNDTVIPAAAQGAMTEEIRVKFRERHLHLGAAFRTLMLHGEENLLQASSRFVEWVDRGIQGFPLPGDGPANLSSEHDLIVSVREGGKLASALINPIRDALGRAPIHTTMRPSENTYGVRKPG